MSEPKTIRVRIAVAVDEAGSWYASGWSDQDPEDTKERTSESLGYTQKGQSHLVWVEADVPLPSVPTIQGTVTEAQT